MEEKKEKTAMSSSLLDSDYCVPPVQQCHHNVYTQTYIYIYIYIIYMYDLSIFAIGTLHGPSCRFVNITQKIAVSLLGQRQHRK